MNSLDGEIDMIPVYSTGTNNLPVSQCPVEDGIVQTPWGAVSVGPLLAGIAAGLQPQMVTLKDLSPGAGGQIVFNGAQVVVDNKFAATLSGK